LVEKPLSNNLDGVDNLIQSISNNNVVNMMGQSYRFHKGFISLKELLDKKPIGKLFHAIFMGGQFLPEWHPQRDYRKEYSARKNLGGGATLTILSHRLDTVRWFFGNIIKVEGWKTRLSDLEIDVDDNVFILLKTDKDIIIVCQADFIQRKHRQKMIISGEEGHIEADFLKNEIRIFNINNEIEDIINYTFEINDMYIEELKYFFKLIEDNKLMHEINLDAGKRILEIMNDPNIKFLK
jgi:predicted dehydrogenase